MDDEARQGLDPVAIAIHAGLALAALAGGGQLVKVLREGRSPDEGAQRIISELKSFSRP